MVSRIRIIYGSSKMKDAHFFNIPIECIRKTRALNIDRSSRSVSRELYKILRSSNGRKIFTPYHGML